MAKGKITTIQGAYRAMRSLLPDGFHISVQSEFGCSRQGNTPLEWKELRVTMHRLEKSPQRLPLMKVTADTPAKLVEKFVNDLLPRATARNAKSERLKLN